VQACTASHSRCVRVRCYALAPLRPQLHACCRRVVPSRRCARLCFSCFHVLCCCLCSGAALLDLNLHVLLCCFFLIVLQGGPLKALRELLLPWSARHGLFLCSCPVLCSGAASVNLYLHMLSLLCTVQGGPLKAMCELLHAGERLVVLRWRPLRGCALTLLRPDCTCSAAAGWPAHVLLV
jgi:hypothetical protein